MSLKSLIEDGYSIRKAASILGMSVDVVKNEIEDNGYCIKKEQFFESCIDRIINLYCSGVSAKSLSIKYSIDKRRIQKWLDDCGKLRSMEESHRLTFFDEHIMDIIDEPAKAYWLGFFYADAYNGDKVNTFNITLKGSDINHIKKIARFFSFPEEKTFRYINNSGIDTSNIKLYSKYLCNKMTELGCPRAKSLILTFPRWLNFDLYNHFIRGLFDGDGCLTFKKKQKEWKWSLAGTQDICNEICNIISKIEIHRSPYYISKTNNNTYVLEIAGNDQIERICSWMYERSDSETRLDRKYELYLELKQQQKNKKNIKKTVMRFDDIIEIDNKKITKKYVQSLSYKEREDLIEPIFNKLRSVGFLFPDNVNVIKKSYKKICDYNPDLSSKDIFNNSSLGTDICKYFCKSFYFATERNKSILIDVFNDDILLKRIIRNRLGMDWLLDTDECSGVNEAFNFSPKMVIQGMRSMRLVPTISIFKPSIAKFVCLKYSNVGDVVGDYSAGFGGRLLGAVSAGRKYVGTDPLTSFELQNMIDFFNINDHAKVIYSGSEHYVGKENSIDLYWSSPPYFDQEVYSQDPSQAYNNGEDYFYDYYWKNTLKNVKFMLKPQKWFGLNVKNYPRMLDMAISIFGNYKETVTLRTIRSHLTKSAGTQKEEYIYMFINDK